MQKLYMSDEEIARSYRGAMNKDAQIGILAELNAVNRTVMRNKLVALGLVQRKIEPIPEPKKPAIERIDEVEAADAIENGRAHVWFESRWPDFELVSASCTCNGINRGVYIHFEMRKRRERSVMLRDA